MRPRCELAYVGEVQVLRDQEAPLGLRGRPHVKVRTTAERFVENRIGSNPSAIGALSPGFRRAKLRSEKSAPSIGQQRLIEVRYAQVRSLRPEAIGEQCFDWFPTQ